MASFFRTVCRAASTVAISGILCASGLSQTQPNKPSEVKRGPAKKLHLTGVSNFGEVTPFLYRGAQPSREGYQGLAKMGIDIVVDARLSGKGAEKKAVNQAGMQYISIPWHCMFPKDHKIAQFLAVLRENPNKKVFVHCRYGDDRTGMMIAAYRMAVENWTAQQAWAEMQQFGMNRRICFPLISYERQFPDRLKKNPRLQGTAMAQP